jgi:hypothetical protein
MTGRNDIAWKRISYRHTVLSASRAGIKNLSIEDRPPQSVSSYLIGGVQKRTEIALPNFGNRDGVPKARQNPLAKS